MMILYRVLAATLLTTTVFHISAQIAQRNIDSLLIVLASAKPDTHKVKSMNALSQNYRFAGDYTQSKIYADSSISLATDLHFLNGKAMGHLLLGVLDYTKGNYAEAQRHYSMSLETYEQAGNKAGMANVMSNIGNIYGRQGNRSLALETYKDALELCKSSGARKLLISINNNIGSVYGAQGNYAEALIYFLDGLKVAREINEKTSEATLLQNVGAIYNYQGNYAEAKVYYKEQLRLMEETGFKEGIAKAYQALAVASQKEKMPDEGILYLQKAITLFKEIGSKPEIAQAQHDIGSLYRQKKNYPEALQNYQSAIQLREELQSKVGIAESHITLGTINAEMAATLPVEEGKVRYADAIRSIEKGIRLAKEAGEIQTERGGYKSLSEIYESMGDYKNSLILQRRFYTLSDSLLNNETKEQIEKQRTAFEVEKAKAEEKVVQDKLLAEQQFANEQEILKRNNLHALAIANEKAEQERLLAEQQCETGRLITEEQARHELALTEEQSRQAIKDAEQKAEVERIRAERVRVNEIIFISAALLFLFSFFFYLYQRQRNLKRKAIEKAETAHKMAELELQSLRAQLNPHFMFNSLNAIQELILMEENDKSHTYLARFAKLLRMLLENANSPFIPLAREIEFLELYLSLEKLRIPDLKYNIKVDPGINTEEIKIPNMILQPYIENAIWHGLSHKQKGDRKIEIRVNQDSMGVRYEIEDNGVGRKRSAELKSMYRKEHRSKGMELLTKRFKLLSDEYRYQIETKVVDIEQNNIAEGTMVAILVPWGMGKELKQTG